jgi:Domain of unknown function (DUF2520)
MKVRKLTGLVCAGGGNRSFLARMPALLGHIGPVAGTSLRVSRRMANSLKAGTGVASFEPLADCSSIWFAVPEASLEELSAQLAAAIPLAGKTVVLCDAIRDSLLPSPLRTSGARVATLNAIPDTNERVFVAEGHAEALTVLRKLLALEHRRLIELRPATKPLYLCGVHLAADLLLPVIAGSVESLRAAGFSREEAIRAVEAIGSRTLRSYGKAGLKAWKAGSAHRLHRAILEEMDALRMTDPRLESLCIAGFASAMSFFAAKSGGHAPRRTLRASNGVR